MDVYELWNELGNEYFVTGSYDEAANAYKKAIDLTPRVGEFYNNVALTCMQLGKYSEASDNYQQSTTLLKDEFDKAISLYKLGEAYARQEMENEAEEAYLRANELLPDLNHVLDISEPADLLLRCEAATGSSSKEDAGTGGAASLSPVPDLKIPQLVEELTPWHFDGQIEPPDDSEFVSDFLFVEELGAYGINEDVISTESLIWESYPSEEEDLPGCESNVAWETTVNDSLQLTEASTVTGMEITMSGAMSIARGEVVTEIETITVEQNDTISQSIFPEDLELKTENITDIDSFHNKSIAERLVVELSEDECLEIQADINKIERVLEVNPANAFAWDTLGEHYKALGRYEDALDAFHKSIGLDSSKAEYFYHLGLVYAVVDRHEEAVNVFEKVLEIDSGHGLAHAILGGYYRKIGNEELAQEHIEAARGLIADNENEYNRACMEAICGNADQSLELLEFALKNKHSYVNLARKDPDLDFIRSDPRFDALLDKYAVKST